MKCEHSALSFPPLAVAPAPTHTATAKPAVSAPEAT